MKAQRNHQGTRARAGGFTLFELLVVLLIIGLVSALVMPRLAASLPGVQLKSSARAVAASLRYARSKAVSESRPYVALFDRTQRLLAVEPIQESIDAQESQSLRVILNTSELKNVYEFPDGVEFGVRDNRDLGEGRDPFPIFFFPQGHSTGGKVVMKNVRRKQYTIRVDTITGAVEIDRL